MRLRRDYIEYLSKRLAQHLVQKEVVELHVEPKVLQARISHTIINDLKVEDELDEEVRRILDGYAHQMRQQHISYHEMFQKVKHKLAKERNLIL